MEAEDKQRSGFGLSRVREERPGRSNTATRRSPFAWLSSWNPLALCCNRVLTVLSLDLDIHPPTSLLRFNDALPGRTIPEISERILATDTEICTMVYRLVVSESPGNEHCYISH